jgi:chemotaxis protein MotA
MTLSTKKAIPNTKMVTDVLIDKKTDNKGRNSRDFSALAGLMVAGSAVAGAFILGRGRVDDLGNLHAGLLVVGGTVGAVLVGTPWSLLGSSLRRCGSLFRRDDDCGREAADHIVRCATLARRVGLPSIEQEAEAMGSGLLRHALLLVVDGVSPQEVRRQLQLDLAVDEERAEADARVFEQAGGYAPTIGIIGAVLGLIQVMKQLGNVEEVGRGIATAFISTLYGVALANLVLLPLAARIRSRARAEANHKELILEGVTAMGEGLSPRVVRMRLETFLDQTNLDQTKAMSGMLTLPEAHAQKAARKTA